MVIWNDLVWAKTGDDVPPLRPSSGSDCLGINAVVTVQVNPYQSLDANTKQTKMFVTTSFALQRLLL